MTPEQIAGLAGRATVLVFGGASLFLNAVGLPGNWVLLVLAVIYAWITHFARLGWVALGIMAGLAVLAEVLEFVTGLTWTAAKGVTRRGTFGAFFGGLVGGVLGGAAAPPLGAVVGAFAGTFAGAAILEYSAEKKTAAALHAGRAAFIGKIVATAIKTLCGFWMWTVLAWRLIAPQ